MSSRLGSRNLSGTRPNDRTPPTLHQACDSFPPLPTLQDAPSISTSGGIDRLSSRQPPRTPIRHGRSLSHPFPSLFGTKKATRKEGNENGSKPASNQVPDRDPRDSKAPLSSGPAFAPDKHENSFKTGECPTCGSSLRWPRHLQVYRCSACLMINDLLPARGSQYLLVSRRKDESTRTAPEKQKVIGKPSLVSVEQTEAITNICILAFLRSRISGLRMKSRAEEVRALRLGSERGTVDTDAVDSPFKPQDTTPCSISASQYISRIVTSQEPSLPANSSPPALTETKPESRPVDFETSKNHNDFERPEGDVRPTSIFAPLEEYLFESLADCECLNASFTLRPAQSATTKSEPVVSKERKEQETFGKVQNDAFSEIDAKTLLLGDIGENGQWWTGSRARFQRFNPLDSNRKASAFKKKALNFDWAAIGAWYNIIFNCGRSWRSHCESLPPKAQIALQGSSEAPYIDNAFLEARCHVQRTFLKVIEKLLRRPGRALKTVEDSRFLIVLLANPLLFSHYEELAGDKGQWSSNVEHEKSPVEQSLPSSIHPQSSKEVKLRPRGHGTGRHYGLVKRILGLISNLPPDCQQAIVSWLYRMPDTLFRNLVDLIGAFVTSRLGKQRVRKSVEQGEVAPSLVPTIAGPGAGSPAHLHSALMSSRPSQERTNNGDVLYQDDWQIRAAAKVMSLLFAANNVYRPMKHSPHRSELSSEIPHPIDNGLAHCHLQPLPTSSFYNTSLDQADLINDFEVWESRQGKFSFCQYPMFLSIWAKIRILEHDAQRQMEIKARDAFFTSILSRKATSQYLVLRIRRDCLVDDSLRSVSEVVGSGQDEIKKGLRIQFVGEEGVDAGGLRKEWFLLLVREVFDPEHGLFVYDEISRYCYFNANSFESSDQFFLVGVVLGLAIYNSTILDVALPPFAFRKLLASAPSYTGPSTTAIRPISGYTLDDLAEWQPELARGLRLLLEYEGDVEETLCRDFVADVERYGQIVQVPLCANGERRPVTNENRHEFVTLYTRYVLDIAVARQFEPFKRGFYTVCAGNSLSLFRPEEIELLVRGSDEPLDISSLRCVALYENWGAKTSRACEDTVIAWFWEAFAEADVQSQRRLLAFITGSDRIPAMGTTSLVIKIVCLGDDSNRFPTARTCFNMIGLYRYGSKSQLTTRIWTAVSDSEGFGFK